MTNLVKRLAQLEARNKVNDASGFAPQTPDWLEYWTQRLLRIAADEEKCEPRSIPLAAFRALVAIADGVEAPATPSGQPH